MEMQLVLSSEVRTLSDENIRRIYGFRKEDDLREAKKLIHKTIHDLELPASFTLDDLHRCRKKVHSSYQQQELDNENNVKNDLFIKHILMQLFPEIHQIPLPDMENVSILFKRDIGINNYSNTDAEFTFKCHKDELERVLHQFETFGLKIIKTDIQKLKNESESIVHVKAERFSLENFNRLVNNYFKKKVEVKK